MKKWTIGGVTVILIGVALSLTFKAGCQVDLSIKDVKPGPMGWDREAALSIANRRLIAQMPPFRIVGEDNDNTRLNVRLWECFQKAGIPFPKNYRQEIGDCTSFGAKNVIECNQGVQIYLGKRASFHNVFPPWIYGASRVLVGNGQLWGDGSTGSWTAKAVSTYGVLASDAAGVPKYSGSIAKQWGRRGPPEQFRDIAKQTLVRTVSQLRSAQDVCDSICNGYACTAASTIGFSRIVVRDGRRVGERSGVWPHQLAVIGYDGQTNTKYFYIYNSWGPDAHGTPLQGEPAGGFWISWADMDAICKQSGAEVFAYSEFDGFPANDDLDFHIFQAAAPFGWIQFGKDFVMAGIVFFSGVLLIVLCVFVARRRHLAFSILLLVTATASGQDFHFIDMPPGQPESFEILDLPKPANAERLDFAFLEPCQCIVAGKCSCPPGQCHCEKPEPEKPKPIPVPKSVRRVLGFKKPNCVPCKLAEADCDREHIVIEWIDIEADRQTAAKYSVGQVPAAVLVVDGHKRGHFVGRTGFANKVREWLNPQQPVPQQPVPQQPQRQIVQWPIQPAMRCSGGVCRSCR